MLSDKSTVLAMGFAFEGEVKNDVTRGAGDAAVSRCAQHEADAAVVVDDPDLSRHGPAPVALSTTAGIGSSNVNTVCPGRER